MAKIKPIYLIGAAAVAVFLFKDKLFGTAKQDTDAATVDTKDITTEVDKDETAKTDVKIDATKAGGIQNAIDQAKAITDQVKDAAVLIKTAAGKKDILVTKGNKRPKSKKKIPKTKKRIKKTKPVTDI